MLSASTFAADVGVSISVGQPGFYGRLDLGGYPPPVLLYPQPVVIEPVPMDRPPLYLRVPPGHAKHWAKHCHEYRACGERVYFVDDGWYTREYAPRYREWHRDRYYGEREAFRDDHRRHEDGRDRREHEGNRGHGRGRGRDD